MLDNFKSLYKSAALQVVPQSRQALTFLSSPVTAPTAPPTTPNKAQPAAALPQLTLVSRCN